MNNAGITSQYGFLFQRNVFILHVLENISPKHRIAFEGSDDVEVSPDDSLFSVRDSDNTYVQVKSRSIVAQTFYKVICNWLLLDNQSKNYILFSEYAFDFTRENDTVKKIILYIRSKKSRKKNSIGRMVYEKYKAELENKDGMHELETIITEILTTFEHKICPMEEIDLHIKEVFAKLYCQDLQEYKIATQKRFERFIQYINKDIDEALKQKLPFVLDFQKFMRIIGRVQSEITADRYTIDVAALKKNKESEAARVVTERELREVSQLCLISKEKAFIIREIVNELLYKDFRETYIEPQEIEISNIEQEAKENFDDVVLSLETSKPTAREKFLETTSKPIRSRLLPDGAVYRKGCYTYLTGDTISPDLQITWGVADDQEQTDS